MSTDATPTLWVRVVADGVFRDALIADPLRALADTPGVAVSADQVRQLEGMTVDERAELVREVLREAMARRARQQWGDRFWSPDVELDPPDAAGA